MSTNYRWAGIGILYAMVVVGLTSAKLAGHIHWPWWLVTLPLWAPVAIVIILALIFIIGIADASRNGENPFQ